MNRVLTRGAGVDVQSKQGETALWMASHDAQLSKVVLLTSTWCADVELRGGNYRTAPLAEAARYQDFSSTAAYSVLDHLLAAGANVDAVDGSSNKRTAPMYLAYKLVGVRGHLVTDSYKAAWKARMLRLLDHVQDPNIADRYGSTVMHILSSDNRALPEIYDVMALLLTRGADVNARGQHGTTALYNAAQNLDMAAAQLFSTTWRADTDIQGDKDYTPLMLACNSVLTSTAGHDMCDYLLKRGADVGVASTRYHQRTALMLVAFRAYHSYSRRWTAQEAAEWKRRMFLMLDVQQNLDYKDRYDQTVLHLLSYNTEGHSEVTDVMNRVLTRGAGVDVQSKHGETALWYASHDAQLSKVVLLTSTWCADVELRGGNYRTAPLAEAARYQDFSSTAAYSVIDHLLAAGANVDAVDGSINKRTAPMYLAYKLVGVRGHLVTDSYKAAWKARMLRLLDHVQDPNI